MLRRLTIAFETFGEQCRDHLGAMCSQRLETPELLISRLVDRSFLDAAAIEHDAGNHIEIDDSVWDLYYQGLFRSLLHEYLRGSGHPDHPHVHAVVPRSQLERDANDPLLRSRLFLHMMSGSDLVPVDSDWKLEVRPRAARCRAA